MQTGKIAQPEARASSAAAMEAENGLPNKLTVTAVGRAGRSISNATVAPS